MSFVSGYWLPLESSWGRWKLQSPVTCVAIFWVQLDVSFFCIRTWGHNCTCTNFALKQPVWNWDGLYHVNLQWLWHLYLHIRRIWACKATLFCLLTFPYSASFSYFVMYEEYPQLLARSCPYSMEAMLRGERDTRDIPFIFTWDRKCPGIPQQIKHALLWVADLQGRDSSLTGQHSQTHCCWWLLRTLPASHPWPFWDQWMNCCHPWISLACWTPRSQPRALQHSSGVAAGHFFWALLHGLQAQLEAPQ